MTGFNIEVKIPTDEDPFLISVGWKAKIEGEWYGAYAITPIGVDKEEIIALVNHAAREAYETEKELLSVRKKWVGGSSGHAPHLQRTVPEEE